MLFNFRLLAELLTIHRNKHSTCGNHWSRKLLLVMVDGIEWERTAIWGKTVAFVVVGNTDSTAKRDLQGAIETVVHADKLKGAWKGHWSREMYFYRRPNLRAVRRRGHFGGENGEIGRFGGSFVGGDVGVLSK